MPNPKSIGCRYDFLRVDLGRVGQVLIDDEKC